MHSSDMSEPKNKEMLQSKFAAMFQICQEIFQSLGRKSEIVPMKLRNSFACIKNLWLKPQLYNAPSKGTTKHEMLKKAPGACVFFGFQ